MQLAQTYFTHSILHNRLAHLSTTEYTEIINKIKLNLRKRKSERKTKPKY